MALKYAVNDTDILDNCVSWWPLNEYSTAAGAVTRYDAHGSNNLTDNNTTASATGQWNRGADFELSNNEYLSVADATALRGTGAFSISCWIKPESLAGGTSFVIAAKEDGSGLGWKLRINHTTLKLAFLGDEAAGGEIVGATTLSTGTWYHVACTVDGSGNATLYLNGVSDGTDTGFSVTSSTGDLNIGRSPYRTTRHFDGVVQDFTVHTAELTSDQVSRLYNSGDGMTYGIDYDFVTNASFGGSATTSKTFSHTCTGTNGLLFVNIGTGADVVTDVTYNSVAMTKITSFANDGALYTSMWYLIGPDTGANDVVITCSSSTNIIPNAISYIGADQSSQPDVFGTDSSSANSATFSVTTTVDNDWLMMFIRKNSGGNMAPGTDTIERVDDSTYGYHTFDSGKFRATGSNSLTASHTTSTKYAITTAFKPVQVASSSLIKSVNGLAKASIKSWNGVTLE